MLVVNLHTGQIVDLLCQEIELLGPALGKYPLSLGELSTQVCTVEPWWRVLVNSLQVLAAELVGKAGLGRPVQ